MTGFPEQLTEKDIERFWSKVEIKGDDECWEWKGTRDIGNYGKLYISSPKRTTLMAHRISYFLKNGKFPLEMKILHICDNPPCCNPNHLKIGTQKDNVDDCIKKGRRSPQNCDNNNRRILNSSQVIETKELYETGSYSAREIAEKYCVHTTTINYILRGISWKEITGEIKIPDNKKSRHKTKLEANCVLEIKELLSSSSFNYEEIGEKYGITASEVSCIARNKVWKNVGESVVIKPKEKHTKGTKLTNEDVLEIKRLLEERILTRKEIAEMFGVNPCHIWLIKTGQIWRDVGKTDFSSNIKGKKLNYKDVIEIKKMLASKNYSVKEIASAFSVCEKTIYNIKNEVIWENVSI